MFDVKLQVMLSKPKSRVTHVICEPYFSFPVSLQFMNESNWQLLPAWPLPCSDYTHKKTLFSGLSVFSNVCNEFGECDGLDYFQNSNYPKI